MPNRVGFLLAEDQALKERFSGITLADDRNAARPVSVFFRYPDGETERLYPFITIEFLDVSNARDRQHSDQMIYAFRGTAPAGQPAGHYTTENDPATFTYWPNTVADASTLAPTHGPANSPFISAIEHVPVNLMYQVSTFTRSALHDRALQSHILTKVAPFRKGYLVVGSDGTHRHMDLLDFRSADLLDEEAGFKKRIFRKVYSLSVTSEIPANDPVGVGQVVDTVDTTGATLSLKDKDTGATLQ